MTKDDLQKISEAAKEGALIATKPWLNVREAALVFGVSEWTIRHAMKAGDIPYSKGLKRELISRQAVETLLTKNVIRVAAERQMKDFINELTRKKARL